MRKLRIIISFAFVTISLNAFGQDGFRTLLENNIQYYQESSKLSYSVNLNMFEDSLSAEVIENEQMHVFNSNNRQCVLAGDRLMIKEDGLTVSVLADQKTVVLQQTSNSFKTEYLEQLEVLLGTWESLTIEEVSNSLSEISYRITLPDGMDYSVMELSFSKKNQLLSKCVIWLSGEYMLSNNYYTSPRIEMTVSNLINTEIGKYRIRDIVTKELELTKKYQSYLFYNTVQK